MKNQSMNIAQIERYLSELGSQLDQQKEIKSPISLLIIGGVYMLLRHQNRASTQDVDFALLSDSLQETSEPIFSFKQEDTTTKPLSPQVKALVSASRIVASTYSLPRNWLNDTSAYFVRDIAPHPEAELWQTFGTYLQVFLPSAPYVLALKLMIARQKDTNDIETLLRKLEIQTRAQAQQIVNQFVPDKAYQEHYMIPKTLDEIFGDDD